MWGRPTVIAAALILVFGFVPTAPARASILSGCTADATCVIDDNLSDTVETFVSRCCKGSVRGVMPGTMWKKTVSDVKDNKSKDDDYKTAWKLISRSEYRK